MKVPLLKSAIHHDAASSKSSHSDGSFNNWRVPSSNFGNVCYTPCYWEWVEDVLPRHKEILELIKVYDAVYTSLFTYDYDDNVLHAFCELWRPYHFGTYKPLEKKEIKVHHYQKLQRPITLGEFLPNWCYTKFTCDGTKALYCNVDKKEAKDETPSCPSPKDAPKLSPEVENPSCPSPKDAPQLSPGVENACMAKITFFDDDILFGDTFHNRPLFVVGFAREKMVNRILVDGGSGINILPIRTMKELGISTTDLTDSRLMIQGFNQGGQRSIGTVKIDLTIGELRSSVWLHVIDAKTSYNIFLGRPWVHENKVIPSTYHQFLKYYEDGVAKRIIADDNPFIEAEAHFVDAKFYLKKYSIKVDAIASGDVGLLNNMAKVAVGKAKVANKEDSKLGNPNKMPNVIDAFSIKKVIPMLRYVPKAKVDKGHFLKLRENALEGLTLPVRRIDTVKSSTKLLGKFVAPNSPLYEALSMKRTQEGFDPNAYRLLAKAGFDPNKPSKLGKLPSEHAMRQQREGLGYKQPPPIRISIKRVSNNYITVEDESTNSNKRPSIFDRLGSSTKRISVFERLGPLRKKNKVWRNSKSMQASALPKSQNAPKDFQSLIPSRMRRHTNIVVSCGEVLKAKSHVVVYTKQRGEDEESVGSSYHVATQDERHIFSPIKIDGELENVSWCYHISFNDGEPQEDEDAKDAPPELEEGVKVTVDALKEINLGTDEDPKPTYVNASLASDEEKAYVDLLKEYKDVFAWSYKEMPRLDPKVAIHHLAVKSGARPIKQAQRRFTPELVPVIETEVNKLIEAGFIREVKDLNNACPKDEFPLPIPELMIDATTGNAFENIKSYLTKPPVLAAPVPGKPLILYISAQERSVGALLAQENGKGKENSLYYLSRMMTPNELKYSPIEKLCLALVFSILKMKHYFQAHVVRIISKANPIKFVMSKPVLNDRLARWYLQFQ
ncbi:hypothetical protein KY285_019065 [Solanum tuberosum]|nr:hypothetical protein KY284_016302 [Solanum tuberosum]KAH0704787.1 hypothetical protein KY285_019065 [Solanum tuberosum]